MILELLAALAIVGIGYLRIRRGRPILEVRPLAQTDLREVEPKAEQEFEVNLRRDFTQDWLVYILCDGEQVFYKNTLCNDRSKADRLAKKQVKRLARERAQQTQYRIVVKSR